MDSLRLAPARAGRDWFIRNDDRHVILQLIEGAVGDNVAGIDAVNLRDTPFGNSGLNATHVSEIALNHIYEGRLAILLNRGCRNQGYALQRIHQQARVYKLVREEGIILVLE